MGGRMPWRAGAGMAALFPHQKSFADAIPNETRLWSPSYAALCAGLVVGSNVLLRPLVKVINRQPIDDTETDRTYVAYAVCDTAAEPRARAILMEGLKAVEHIEVSELEIENIEDTDRVEL